MLENDNIREEGTDDTMRVNERLIESMKRMRLKNVDHDEKIKLILSDLDITISGHKFALLFDFKRRDVALGYSTSIKEKKRNLRLHNKKLSVDDANEIFEFFKALAVAKQVIQ